MTTTPLSYPSFRGRKEAGTATRFRLKPRTLLARTVILIAVLLVAGQIAWITLFELYEREPRAKQIAHRAASVVNLTRAALLAAHPDKRPALLQELNRREGIRVYLLDPLELAVPLPEKALLRMVAEEIQRELGPATEVMFRQDDVEGLWVSFAIDDDEYWVVMPQAQVNRDFPWQWLGWGGLVLGMSILGAWAVVARINRPLQVVAAAAEAVGKGETPPVLEEQGAAEIQALSSAFNRMSAELQSQEADRALLLAGISHDLRTPISRLRLGIEITCPDQQEKLAMIQDLEDMEHVIDQFLDFARPETVQPKPADLNALVAELAEQYGKRGVSATLELDPLPLIPVRTAALRRALRNLIENALAYAGLQITLRTRLEDGHAVLSVLDRGPGVPESELERLKQPFKRLDAARSGARGSGLGLAIVERIARMHGGRLVLRNRDGGGLEARVELASR